MGFYHTDFDVGVSTLGIRGPIRMGETSPAGGNFDQFFVHWLDEMVIRAPNRLDRNPRARPWLGDFGIKTRRGLISHLAVLRGRDLVRQRLTYGGSREAFEKALMLRPKEALEFKATSAVAADVQKT